MDISAIQPHIKASDVPFDQLAANKSVPENEKVNEAARQFEAVLLRQILQQARKPLLDKSAEANSSASGIYDDMVNNQLADSISKSGTFGLAKSLQTQLAHQILPKNNKATATLSQQNLTQKAPPSHDRQHPQIDQRVARRIAAIR